LRKIRNGKLEHVPEYRKFWQVFDEDKFQKKKVVKEGKKKK
jgi:hypothetical protein